MRSSRIIYTFIQANKGITKNANTLVDRMDFGTGWYCEYSTWGCFFLWLVTLAQMVGDRCAALVTEVEAKTVATTHLARRSFIMTMLIRCYDSLHNFNRSWLPARLHPDYKSRHRHIKLRFYWNPLNWLSERMNTCRPLSANGQPLNTAVSVDVLALAIRFLVGLCVGINVAFSIRHSVDCMRFRKKS